VIRSFYVACVVNVHVSHLSVPPRCGQVRRGGQHAAHLAPPHDEYRPKRYRCHFDAAVKEPGAPSDVPTRGSLAVHSSLTHESTGTTNSRLPPASRGLSEPTTGYERLPHSTLPSAAAAGADDIARADPETPTLRRPTT